jgi:hypothetical protein
MKKERRWNKEEEMTRVPGREANLSYAFSLSAL